VNRCTYNLPGTKKRTLIRGVTLSPSGEITQLQSMFCPSHSVSRFSRSESLPWTWIGDDETERSLRKSEVMSTQRQLSSVRHFAGKCQTFYNRGPLQSYSLPLSAYLQH